MNNYNLIFLDFLIGRCRNIFHAFLLMLIVSILQNNFANVLQYAFSSEKDYIKWLLIYVFIFGVDLLFKILKTKNINDSFMEEIYYIRLFLRNYFCELLLFVWFIKISNAFVVQVNSDNFLLAFAKAFVLYVLVSFIYFCFSFLLHFFLFKESGFRFEKVKRVILWFVFLIIMFGVGPLLCVSFFWLTNLL